MVELPVIEATLDTRVMSFDASKVTFNVLPDLVITEFNLPILIFFNALKLNSNSLSLTLEIVPLNEAALNFIVKVLSLLNVRVKLLMPAF